MEKNTVVIGIPIYKKSLNQYEMISLQQVSRILGRYTIKFIAASSLTFDYEDVYINWEVERFPDEFFKNTVTYSQLLMSDSFYQRFNKYQYLLIYQLDAFVFFDHLGEFCTLGFDYIGAPWPFYLGSPSGYRARVGNGGFSLRKISAFRKILRQKERIFAREPKLKDWFSKVEDGFFGYCGVKPELNFHVPDVRTALMFSMEHKIAKHLPIEKGKMPFGCHGWYKLNYELWKPIVASYGYSLPAMAGFQDTTELLRLNHMAYYLCQRRIRTGDKSLLREFFQEIIPGKEEKNYKIWGGGVVGKSLLCLMHSIGLFPAVVYDRSGIIDGLSCRVEIPPTREVLRKRDSIILVATTKCYAEIEGYLLDAGLVKGRDFIAAVVIFRRLAARLYPCMKTFF